MATPPARTRIALSGGGRVDRGVLAFAEQLRRFTVSVQRADIHVALAAAHAPGLPALVKPSIHQAAEELVPALAPVPKGVQRVEDVIRAISYGVDGVVLSNHGGRQLDFARSGIEVLAEVMPELRRLGLQDKLEIFVDGGVRRATDIIKALCLGATGVGIGRPFLYAMSAYGLPGVDRAMQLLKDEMEMNMRLIGCSSVDQLGPDLVDTRALSMHTAAVPQDTLGINVYDPLSGPQEKAKL